MSLLTKDLIKIVEQSEIDALEDRLIRVKSINDNAMGVELKRFGYAVAFSVKNIPGPSFNTVKGVNGEDMDHLDEIVEFYASRGIPAQFEVTPGNASTDLFRKLSSLGYFQSGFHTALYRPLSTGDPSLSGADNAVQMEEISLENFDVFGELYTRGFGMPTAFKDYVTANNKVLAESDNWTFYLARVGGEPAGIGVLHVKNDVATLAASATVPEFRNKGVQTALIQKRMQQAADEGCRYLVGQAAFGSVSQKNMQRAGLNVAYTNAVWEKL
ncbi:GNAT family N-acetyltransferase [Sutcliffiella horikoshii]|uniref:GNAT family N-acetyltransferase n=1 Tax=Sutcliffiella horikoshii TaxID=79883 RepID=A0A5D4T0Z4_9BACI|nr:GNAT family N-acetyltransferase [Sutcliffiella horikoshii]TYS69337.1 GNAT family N-acetyltransferase [Sutcliffiella horikoshii]